MRAEKTEKEAINLAIQQLRHVGARILGVVVNDAKPDPADGETKTRTFSLLGVSRALAELPCAP